MSSTLEKIRELVGRGEVKVSAHGYDELANDGLSAREIVEGINEAVLVEDYPNFPKGPCVLVLQKDRERRPVHVVWGIPRDQISPAVAVTAYRPDPAKWTDDFMRRSK